CNRFATPIFQTGGGRFLRLISAHAASATLQVGGGGPRGRVPRPGICHPSAPSLILFYQLSPNRHFYDRFHIIVALLGCSDANVKTALIDPRQAPATVMFEKGLEPWRREQFNSRC